MKKLMIAAAAAALTAGVYAGACDDIGLDEAGCMVYDVQIKVKTLGPKKMKCKSYSDCNECTDYVYYLDKVSRTIKGYAWLCYEDCIDQDTEMNIALWEPSTKTAIITLPYAVEGNRIVQYPNVFNFDFIGRYGKKAKNVASAWTLDAENISLALAGIDGSCDYDKETGAGMLKNVSGSCAGTAVPATIINKKLCEDPEESTALIAGICDCWDSWCDSGDEVDTVPAVGTWSFKYNKKLSTGAKTMLQLVPSYVKEAE